MGEASLPRETWLGWKVHTGLFSHLRPKVHTRLFSKFVVFQTCQPILIWLASTQVFCMLGHNGQQLVLILVSLIVVTGLHGSTMDVYRPWWDHVAMWTFQHVMETISRASWGLPVIAPPPLGSGLGAGGWVPKIRTQESWSKKSPIQRCSPKS